jgi:nicotinamidase-related amidase
MAVAHNWSIPTREYARHEERRGRRHAFEHLDPRTTALVVVDMVPFFEGNAHSHDTIERINLIAGALRRSGGTVAWILPSADDPHPELSREFYGEAVAEMFRMSGGEGPLPNRLCAGLQWLASDLFAEKQSASAFFPGHCDLHDVLATRAIRTVIVTGVVTHVCCEGTVRDAKALGYRVIMVADGNATVSDAVHNATLFTVYRSFGDVRPTDEVLGLITQAEPNHEMPLGSIG